MSFPSSPDAEAAPAAPPMAVFTSTAPSALPEIPPPAILAIHLDLLGGLAGDMFVAALVDALPGLEAGVLAELAKVQPAGAPRPCFRTVVNGGMRARRFGLEMPPAGVSVGTSYAALRRHVAEAPLDPRTREHALALLALLGEAEAAVHGIAIDAVHFHELADWDSLLDLVATGAIAARLAGACWSASALPVGGGSVAAAHGRLPVPAPATSHLLRGYSWCDDGIGGERVTPTGAAILRHLVPPAACGGHRGTGTLVAVGCGAGTRELADVPNIARATVFERSAGSGVDRVALVEFDVDDMTGEEIALAADRLRALPGALDVSVGARTGKKGRPVADFRVLAAPAAVDAIVQACFTETSTLGLRLRDESRRVLARKEFEACAEAAAAGDRLRVKVAERPDGERTAKAAQDDVAQADGLAQRRRLRAAGEGNVLGGEGT